MEFVCDDDRIIAVADPVKEDSNAAVAALKRMGLRVVLLTGDNARTAAAIVAGTMGAIYATVLARIFKVTHPIAEGTAIGACSHALGTTKALEIGELQGAMSSIAICICGILTSFLVLFLG